MRTPIKMKIISIPIQIFLILFSFMWISASADTPHPHSKWSFATFGLTPIQSGGRLKPFDSFAREVILFETGSRTFQNWNSLDLLLSWIAYPDFWNTQAFISLKREDIKRQLGLPEKQNQFSPQELFSNQNLLQYAEQSQSQTQNSSPPGAPKASARDQELKSLFEKLSLFHGIISGKSWLLQPKPAPDSWESLVSEDPEGEFIRNQFAHLLQFYQEGAQEDFEKSSLLLKASVEGEIPNYQETF